MTDGRHNSGRSIKTIGTVKRKTQCYACEVEPATALTKHQHHSNKHQPTRHIVN